MGIFSRRAVIGLLAAVVVLLAAVWLQPWNSNDSPGNAATSNTSTSPPTPTQTTPILRTTPRASTPSATPTTAKRSLKCYYGPGESDYLTFTGACPPAYQESPVDRPTPNGYYGVSDPADPKLQEWLEQYGRNGTQQEPPAKCTPGYSPCLPPAYDYDCRGGSGNGPAYTGRVYVTGPDIYGLDRDGDGIGCE